MNTVNPKAHNGHPLNVGWEQQGVGSILLLRYCMLVLIRNHYEHDAYAYLELLLEFLFKWL